MKKTVSIARALKEKNRIAGKLAKTRELIKRENSRDERVPRRIDIRALQNDEQSLMDRLVSIKIAIATANTGIIAKIVELDEVKAKIAYMNSIDTKEGYYEEDHVIANNIIKNLTAEIHQGEVIEMVNALQKRVEELQDEIDEYNAITKIEIELDE